MRAASASIRAGLLLLLAILICGPTVQAQPLAPERATEKEAEPAPGGDASLPQIRVLSPRDGAGVASDRVRLRLAIRSDPAQPEPRLSVAVNGVPTRARGLLLTSEAAPTPGPAPGETVRDLEIVIPPQDCAIAVRPVTEHGEGPAAVVRLRWRGAEFLSPPDLYVLAIGVAAYQRPELQLRYAAKDAWDVAQAFKRQAGSLFGRTVIEVLVDQDATYLQILRKLEWLQRQATARDVAVLFLAGHGITDPSSGEYYFLAHEADPGNVTTTMVSQHQIQSALRNTAGKVLLFLDTCHSGSVFPQWRGRGAEDVQSWVQELSSTDTGVIAFTAATGRQQSKESAAWQNGAFSRALVEGLLGRAAYMPNRPITVNMLELYISERVKDLTSGTQTPTTARPASMPDFPIAVQRAQPVPLVAPAPKPRPLLRRPWLWAAVLGGAVVVATGLGLMLGLRQADAEVPAGAPVFDQTFGLAAPASAASR